MFRWFTVLVLLIVSVPAWAGTIAIVDFERAVNETEEGQEAQKRLDTMYSTRKDEIERLRKELETDMEDYKSRQLILSEDARAETEKKLMEKQQTFESTYSQYQSEMQETYYMLLQDLDTKMRALTEKIAKEKGYSLVIDKAAVVYVGDDTVDMTDLLIKRYNAQDSSSTATPAPEKPE